MSPWPARAGHGDMATPRGIPESCLKSATVPSQGDQEPPICSRASGDRLIGAAAQMGLICARPAWLTLLTDVSALPRVARLGIMQDVFRWSVVVHTRIVPPPGCRPLRRRRAEASARTCCRGRVLGQHCCPDPAGLQTGDPRRLGQQLRTGQPRAAPRRGTDTDIGTTASRLACKASSWSGFCWPVAWLGANQVALLRRTEQLVR